MDSADRRGLGLAAGGHLLLLAALTIGIARRHPVAPPAEAIDVQMVDAVGLRSAAPEPATEAPREAEAPDSGPPEEAAPAPAPRPAPVPSPSKPAPPVTKPAPAPAKPPPAPVPTAKPEPTATPAPSPKPKAAKPAVPAPRLAGGDLMRDLSAAATVEAKAGAGKGKRSTGSRLGPDFLKGIAGPSAGRGEHARASVSGPALNGLAAAIKRQVQPCYELGSLGGTAAMQIVTVLELRFNRDGTVAGSPRVVEQTGVNDGNRGYSQQMADLSRRAVLRCAPLKLPPELYAGGWESITMSFTPGQMQ